MKVFCVKKLIWLRPARQPPKGFKMLLLIKILNTSKDCLKLLQEGSN